MEIKDFAAHLNQLCTYYEKQRPSDGTVRAWHHKLRNLPAEYLPWAYDAITDRNERFPANIPNVMWALYHEWRNAHPEKCAPQSMMGPKCSNPWCDEGLMHVVKRDDDGRHNVWVYRCDVCRSAEQAFPYATPGQLQAEGFDPDTMESTMDRFRKKMAGAPRRRNDGEIDWRRIANRNGG